MLEEEADDENMKFQRLLRLLRLWPLALLTCCVLACCLPCIGCCISNDIKIKNLRAEFEKASDVASTPLGDIEYSIKGKAPYVMICHGSPGIHDGVICRYDHFLKHGFGVIVPSRPGYGRSKLKSSTRRYPEQADAYAALLDHLSIDKVGIYGWSGGGPLALNIAGRHPDRVNCLILESATTGNFKDHREEITSNAAKWGTTSVLMSRIMAWYSKKNFLGVVKDVMMPTISNFNAEERE